MPAEGLEPLFESLTPPYSTIVADPPWSSQDRPRINYGKGRPERHYPIMSVDTIAALDVSSLAADDAHLWLWGVNCLLDAAFTVARAWGFKPLGVLTWCKPGPGIGYYMRTNTEHAVFATRGKPIVPPNALPSSWWSWRRESHSVKPAAFADLVETISPGPYIELFARQPRLGWNAWGNGHEERMTNAR